MDNNIFNSSLFDFLDEGNTNDLLFILNCENRKVRFSKTAQEYFGVLDKECKYILKKNIDSENYIKFQNELDLVIRGEKKEFYYSSYVINAKGDTVFCTFKGKNISNAGFNTIIGSITPHISLNYYDPITNLKTFNHLIEDIRTLANNSCEFLTLGIDINKFHEINSIYGYNFGNKLLYRVANIFQVNLENDCQIYRIQGTSFAVIIKNTDANYPQKLFQSLKKVVENITLDSISLNLVITGCAIVTTKYNSDPQALISCLNAAIEKSKDNNYEFVIMDDRTYDEDTKRLQLLNTIKASIINNCEGFKLRYQPFVSTMSGTVIGAEALIRWENDEYGEVSPYHFIEYIESQPCFYDLGLWIIKKAITDMKEIVNNNPKFFINVNVSYSQLQRETFGWDVVNLLESEGFPTESLQFELTERCRNIDIDFLKKQLNFFKKKGIKFALDDFGTGISSIDLLCNLPISSVKIDQSFIRNILVNNSCKSVVDMSLECARKLGLSICLEGVENQEVYDYTMNLNASYHQGYYYSKPLVLEDFIPLIKKTWKTDKISLIKSTGNNMMNVNNVLSMMPGGFFMYFNDEKQRIININQTMLSIFECDTVEEFEQLTGGTFKGMVHPDDYDIINNSINKQIDDSKDNMDYVEYRIITKFGKVKNIIDYGHLVETYINEDFFCVFIVEKH